jgi:hypothetical protein
MSHRGAGRVICLQTSVNDMAGIMRHNARDQASCSHLPASVLCDQFDDS